MTRDWIDYRSTTNEQCFLKVDQQEVNSSDEFFDCPEYYEYYMEWC